VSTAVEQLTAQALALAERDRLAVATALWKSLKNGGHPMDEEMASAISRARAQELDEGKVRRLSHDEVFKGARSALK
jgi:hypothetical protein